MKRLAYSLIGFGLLWFVTIAALPENLQDDYWAPHYSIGRAVKFTSLIIIFIFYPLAGWLLSATSVPKEVWGHNLAMAFAAGVIGLLTSVFLMAGTVLLKDWLFPGPPLTDIHD